MSGFPTFRQAWRESFRINPEPIYRYLAGQLTRWLWRPRYVGFNKIPDEGAVIIIANHVSYVDGLIINAGCNRPIRYIIDEEIYRWPGIHYFMKHNRAIPILPNRDSVKRALHEISEGLRAGDAICIFPEGQLTYTGRMGRFRSGIESIIARDPVPIYPVALKGLWGSLFSRRRRSSGMTWLRTVFRRWRFPVQAICGAPVPPEKAQREYLRRVILDLRQAPHQPGWDAHKDRLSRQGHRTSDAGKWTLRDA